MINDLFINSMIVLSFTFIVGAILKEVPEKIQAKHYFKIGFGILLGLVGALLLNYNITIPGTNTMIDLRLLILMIAESIGIGVTALIPGAIIALYRLSFSGINISSIAAITHIILALFTFYLINKKIKNPWRNWYTKLFFLILSSLLIYGFVLNQQDIKHISKILSSFVVVLAFIGTLEYFLLGYILRSNELFLRYKKDSAKDFLTGLNNTRAFDKLINDTFRKTQENKEPLSCLMIDIDHFKKVNDTYGHATGDLVLAEFANILTKSSRPQDILGRVGGEEFCMLLIDCPPQQALNISLRIKKAVQEHRFPIGENQFIHIAVSIGIATYPSTIEKVDQLLLQADHALYDAKQSGRNRVCNNENVCYL